MGSNSNAIAVLWSLCISICFVLKLCHAANTIRPGESMGQNETLVSAGGNFVLGFFNPDRSQNYYLGIWYNKASVKTIVWVANREKPVNNSSGVLQIRNDGNLVVSNGAGTYFWSSNVSVDVNSQTATLLDTGNLVLSKGEDENPEKFLWQSFDYPSDTLLPGMKLGLDRKTGLNRFLTSWRSRNDPSPGDFYYKLDPQGSPQLFILNGADRKYRSGPWIGYRFSGTPELNPHFVFNFTFINNQKEIYYIYSIPDISVISRLVLDQSGKLQRFRWNERNAGWDVLWENPKDICDKYEKCGSFGNCNSMRSPECSCLPGFEPKSPRNWFLRDFFDGCVRRTNLSCVTGDGFEVVKDVKLPDTSAAIVEKSLSLNDCETKCMNNCNCTAFANADIDGNGSGCLIWIGNLIDVRELPKVGQELHLRLAASELGKGNETKRVILIATLTVVSTVLLLSSITYYLWTRKAKPKAQDMKKSQELLLLDLRKNVAGAQEPSDASKVDDNGKNDLELWLLDLNGIAAATDNFSDGNKVGEGGFGPVYKGKLPDGQEIAVKRLSKRSGQGHEEFKTEVLLISKLQHRNLVRLLGCCIQAEEKILIYEYMPNKSLDLFLFDQTRSTLLDWGKRFNIILGIARGLLYLHQDSRLRIIHRDLKASNILLDGSMNPKIADFGMARIFQGNQTEVVTTRVVGTYGYMSPEYLMDGLFSEKSDVFSFGVLLLEIVCGKKNKMFDQSGHSHNLLGQVWNLWKEDRCLELIDPSMGGTYSTSEVLRSIQVGLLCVQEWTVDRPAMSSTILMLSSEAAPLPLPKQPAFFTRRTQTERDSSSNQYGSCSINEITVTLEDGR